MEKQLRMKDKSSCTWKWDLSLKAMMAAIKLPSPPHILAKGCSQVGLSQVVRKTTGAEGRREF